MEVSGNYSLYVTSLMHCSLFGLMYLWVSLWQPWLMCFMVCWTLFQGWYSGVSVWCLTSHGTGGVGNREHTGVGWLNAFGSSGDVEGVSYSWESVSEMYSCMAWFSVAETEYIWFLGAWFLAEAHSMTCSHREITGFYLMKCFIFSSDWKLVWRTPDTAGAERHNSWQWEHKLIISLFLWPWDMGIVLLHPGKTKDKGILVFSVVGEILCCAPLVFPSIVYCPRHGTVRWMHSCGLPGSGSNLTSWFQQRSWNMSLSTGSRWHCLMKKEKLWVWMHHPWHQTWSPP